MPPPESSPCFNHDALNHAILDPLGETYGLGWEELYWGTNLPRLKSIKAAYDPQGIFTCRDCLTAGDAVPVCPAGCEPELLSDVDPERRAVSGA